MRYLSDRVGLARSKESALTHVLRVGFDLALSLAKESALGLTRPTQNHGLLVTLDMKEH